MRAYPDHERHTALLVQYGLRELPPEAVVRLLFKKGDFLCMEGQPLAWLLFVLEGSAKVCVMAENGKTMLCSIYAGGGVLGDVELMMPDGHATTTVQAVTDVQCLGISMQYCREAFMENNAFLMAIGSGLAAKLDDSTKNSAFTLLYTLETRLCSYILQVQEGGLFEERLTVLAELMGTSYRHLLRTLEALCAQGVLQKKAKGYEIKDFERLKSKSRAI